MINSWYLKLKKGRNFLLRSIQPRIVSWLAVAEQNNNYLL